MKILVTGAAGFIGYHVCELLLREDVTVVGLDNLNDYYDLNLKYARLAELGIEKEKVKKNHEKAVSTSPNQKFSFYQMSLEDREALPLLFQKENFDIVCNLAAQAGVRYSIENPEVYVDSNLTGFLNLLECCRHNAIKHLVYASSSSVYGNNSKIPFSVEDNVDHPISLYAATKKSNELMAHAYSHLFKIPTTGIRFFTVYGPWGRPDMAAFLFANAISNNQPVKVFNGGNMQRDFTYVTDIADGVVRILKAPLDNRKKSNGLYKLYNMGNNSPIKLLEFIKEIEIQLKVEAKKQMFPMQPGDVKKTWADTEALIKDYDYKPSTSLKVGVQKYISWYKKYYNNQKVPENQTTINT